MNPTTNTTILGQNSRDQQIARAKTETPLQGSISPSNTITSSSLAPVTPFVLPPTPTSSAIPGLNATIAASNQTAMTNAEKQQAQDIQDQKNNNDNLQKNILDILGQTGNEKQTYNNELVSQGGDIAKKQADEYTSQIEQEQLANRRQVESLFKNGALSSSQAQNEADALSRTSLSKQADLSILQNAALRKYDTASAIATRKTEMELEPLKTKLAQMNFLYTNNKENLTKNEQRQYEQKIKSEERTYNDQKIEKDASNKMIMNALQGKAPASLVQQAQSKLASGGNAKEVAKILGQYSVSEADRLDLRLKKLQGDKINSEINKANTENAQPKVATVKTDAGTFQWNDKTKRYDIPVGSDANGTTPQSVNNRLTIQDKVDSINNLINHPGLAGSVGPNALARLALDGDLFNGVRTDFIAGVQQLVSKDTLDTLLNLKKAGGTLGALSEGEGKMLRSAATKIGTYTITDDKGNVIGYKASEKAFKKELETIRTLSDRALSAVGGAVKTPQEIADEYINNQVNKSLEESNSPYGAYTK